MPDHVLVYLLAINALAFCLMAVDKWKAVRGGRRVPESTLLLPAALLGCVGSWGGAFVFRHKTAKTSFRVKHALATAVGLLAAWWLFVRGGP